MAPSADEDFRSGSTYGGATLLELARITPMAVARRLSSSPVSARSKRQ